MVVARSWPGVWRLPEPFAPAWATVPGPFVVVAGSVGLLAPGMVAASIAGRIRAKR